MSPLSTAIRPSLKATDIGSVYDLVEEAVYIDCKGLSVWVWNCEERNTLVAEIMRTDETVGMNNYIEMSFDRVQKKD